MSVCEYVRVVLWDWTYEHVHKYVFVWKCEWMCECVHVLGYVSLFMCLCICEYVHVWVNACTCSRLWTSCVDISVHENVCVLSDVSTCTGIVTYMEDYISMFVYVRMLMYGWMQECVCVSMLMSMHLSIQMCIFSGEWICECIVNTFVCEWICKCFHVCEHALPWVKVWLCLCVYVWACVCVWGCLYVSCFWVNLWVCLCVGIFVCGWMWVYSYVYVDVGACLCVCVNVWVNLSVVLYITCV